MRRLWQGWKLIAEKVGVFQAKVILRLLYLRLLGPIALARMLVCDRLGLRRKRPPETSSTSPT